MANHQKVRAILLERGIDIPATTVFIGALHDTTRDEIQFYDELSLPFDYFNLHKENEKVFLKALDHNAKERSRRLLLVNTRLKEPKIHEIMKLRSFSLFEPRPELNHATNALCIVGRRELTKSLFLDRRAFLNSFDYRVDPEGKYLLGILNAVAPVCGGINLEYFFSRVDNQKLGAGTKLPHNVMGLFGVANGYDGDLRPGLPSQMIELHDPVRLMVMVEHFPEVILSVIRKNDATYEWFQNEWVHLVSVHPETRELSIFRDGRFFSYETIEQTARVESNLKTVIESSETNLPVFIMN